MFWFDAKIGNKKVEDVRSKKQEASSSDIIVVGLMQMLDGYFNFSLGDKGYWLFAGHVYDLTFWGWYFVV